MFRRAQFVVWLAALTTAALASSSAGQGPPGGSPPGLDKAKEVKEKHADKLLDKPGIAGIGVGLKPNGTPVIRIYKEKADVADVPEELEGVSVDSVVTGVIEPRAPTDRFPRPVPIGVSSGLSGVATGTLGVRVSDGTNVYALSNNHVYAGVNTASIGDPIIQPGDVDGGSDPADRIATLAAYQQIDFNGGNNTMDAAIALTSPANVGTATPADGYGAPSPITAPASIGLAVQKYGRTTGLQLGDVAATNVTVDVCYVVFFETCLQEARFVQQISVSPGPFSAPGDSGSLIVTQGGNQPVALLFAGGDGLTIGTPIDLVLQRFGVTIDGSSPPEGPPSAPNAVSALAGDASATLSWTTPSFDGGSPVSGYKVYRGTSPNPTTAVATLGVQTSYLDSGLVNGVTYYYKVSALNANGESPLSNEVSATPEAAVPPSTPLAIVDNFNRANENPLSDGGRWSNSVIPGESGFHVTSNQLACAVTTTCTAWRNATQYGPDVEVSARVATSPGNGNFIRLYARLQQPGQTGYLLRTSHTSGTDQVWLERFAGGATTLLAIPQELSAGDTIMLRVHGTTLEAWRHDGSSWSRLGFVHDATYSAPGYVGVGLRGTTGRLDDFAARSLSQSPPGAPTGMAAAAADDLVALTWNAPAFDGGSPITHYRVQRGTSPGSETFLAASTSTTHTDATAQNGTTYYYKVSAVNGNGESPLSNEAKATPIAVVVPAPLAAPLDNFNRANENPLSDAGRWSNDVIGGGLESGHHVTGNELACTRTTTCTAWRNNAQFGPDVEVWARLTTLPGLNNHPRIYGRLQRPGATAAYMLRTNQLSGTDEVYLERFDNGAATRLLTTRQELAAGDTLLLRVKGTTVEAWRQPSGGPWSRLGVVQDATHAAAGYVAIGLRGTTGRVDDFGARTLGGPPPDTENPSPPGTLSTNASSSTQIDLSWGAATDNVGVTRYRIERCQGAGCSSFAEIATVNAPTTSYSNSGLTGSTSYSYRVRAEDAALNLGAYSNTASAATPAPPDTENPSPPGTLSTNASSSTQIDLSWGAATDNVGVTRYRIERCQGAGCSSFAEIATVNAPTTSYSNSGLTGSTSYSYRVRAEDAALNLGAYSNTASAATPAPPDTENPSPPGTLSTNASSSTQIDLSWGAATDNVGVTRYRIERCQGAGCSSFAEIATVNAPTTSYSNSGLTGSTSYSYRVRAEDAALNLGAYSNTASAATQAAPKPIYFSLEANGTVGGISAANEDVVFFDGASTFSLAFDGSDVGLSSRRLDAFTWLDSDSLLFSLDNDGASLPGAGTVDDSDIVRFDASSLGSSTAGTFSMYFDGSDVGLTTNAEDVDAFELLTNGNLLVSTEGSVGVTGVSGGDEDLLTFAPGTLGAATSGTFAMYFDGSDVGLTANGEDIDAAAVDAAGRIHLSTRNDFAVAGASGTNEDVFVFTPSTLGANTTGTFGSSLYFDGSAFGLAGNNVFAIDLPPGA